MEDAFETECSNIQDGDDRAPVFSYHRAESVKLEPIDVAVEGGESSGYVLSCPQADSIKLEPIDSAGEGTVDCYLDDAIKSEKECKDELEYYDTSDLDMTIDDFIELERNKVVAESSDWEIRRLRILDKKVIQCEKCPVRFTRIDALKRHVRVVHEHMKAAGKAPSRAKTLSKEKLVVCDECGNKYRSKYTLEAHRRLHTGEKPYKCPVAGCGYESAHLSHITTHMRIHTGEKPYHCDFPGCSYKGSKSSHLLSHKRVHSSERPYRCDIACCSFTAKDRGHLNTHKRNSKLHSGKS